MPHHYLNGSYLICRNDKFLFIRFMVRKHIRDIGSGCEHVLFQYPCGQNGWRIHSRRGRFTYRVPKPLHGICTHVLCWTIIGLPKFEQTQFFVMVKKPHVVSTTNLRSRTSNPGLQFQVMETRLKVSNSDLRGNRKIFRKHLRHLYRITNLFVF